MKKVVISIVLVNLLAACASEKPKETVSAPAPITESKTVSTVPVTAPAPASSSSSSSTPPSAPAVDPLNDPQKYPLLARRSLYYALDSSVVQDADKAALQAHAIYLSEHPNRKIRLEGNCDERGSNEYNLGLGQRRADGVRKLLELGGAKPGQIESVSYGEEKPKSTAHDETGWAQNRRTDLMYAR